MVEMYTQEREEELLAGDPSFVLDAIDNIDTKVGCCLPKRCWHKRLLVHHVHVESGLARVRHALPASTMERLNKLSQSCALLGPAPLAPL